MLTAHAEVSSGMDVLSKMNTAAQNLTYEGVFSYQSGNTVQSIQIFHRSDSRGQKERLIALNGAAREVIRTDDMVTCIYPEGKKVNVSRRPFGRGFPSDLPRRLSSAAPFYHVEKGNTVRTAGRQAIELLIKPVDEYRYGYHLWVDEKTHLLLKAQLINNDSTPLETFAFSAVKTGIHIPDHKFEPEIDGEQMNWMRSEPNTVSNEAENFKKSDWHFSWLPDGFNLSAHQTRLRGQNGAYIDHRVFSDGLSSVSVFIEKIRAQHSHLHGGSHMGALNAFGTILNAHFVTVVGEVPAVTVEKIGANIEYTAEVSK
jgi:sigma-E factor negative regulatory protein RseB